MKSFEYGDQEVGDKEITVAVSSMILGVGIITLPRMLAGETNASDGWISLLLAGGIVCFFTYIIGKLVSRFPKAVFFAIYITDCFQPLAYVITFIFGIYALSTVAFQVRSVANISRMYLFNRTPTEVLVLIFLLVVVYAVSGSRAAILDST